MLTKKFINDKIYLYLRLIRTSTFDEHKRLNELINHYDTLVSEVLLENEKSKM